ncbi:hypothetical protein BH10CHL1_BH10CHL1_22500 [soil metagenome]
MNDFWQYTDANGWQQLSADGAPGVPGKRADTVMVWDNNANRLLLFGGQGGINAGGEYNYNDLWQYTDAGGWQELIANNDPASPQARGSSGFAWSSSANALYIFGGITSVPGIGEFVFANDLWKYSTVHGWELLTANGDTNSPMQRMRSTGAWDQQKNRFLMFAGGGGGLSLTNDLWQYTETGGWQQLTSQDQEGSPAVRGDHTTVWDNQNNRMLVFAGYGGPREYNDLWQYSDGDVVPTPTPAPPVLSIADASQNLRTGQNNFTLPVHFLHNATNVSALDFTLAYDQSCLTFDAITDSDNDGLPDALIGLPNGFDASLEHNNASGTIKLLIKPPAATPPLPTLSNGDIAQFTFGVQPSCVTNDGTPKTANFVFSAYSFGNDQGETLAGNASDGIYTLYFNIVPSAIALTNAAVGENLPAGTTVGMISSTPGDGETYTLVDGAGDNSNFTISSNLLKTATSFDFEAKNSYSVRIRTTDSYDNTFEKDFTVTINDNNDAPVAHDDITDPPLIVIGDGNPVRIDVLANETDQDANTTLIISAVTQGSHGAAVQNNASNVSYTASPHYDGPDSFSYTAQDPGGLPANANVALYAVANDARGNCNGDSSINAADFPSLVLEIFDTDAALSWWRSAEQGFHGSPRGCDANVSQNGATQDQASTDASDIICTVLVFFGHPDCTNGQVLAAHTAVSATLSVSPELSAVPGQTVTVPLTLMTAGNRIAAATFAFNFDPAHLSFNDTDADNDGVPDAIRFAIPASLTTSANYNVAEHRLEVAIFGVSLPMPLLKDGVLAMVTLQVANDVTVTATPLTLTLVSVGDDQGETIPVTTSDGSLQIKNPQSTQTLFLPVIQR